MLILYHLFHILAKCCLSLNHLFRYYIPICEEDYDVHQKHTDFHSNFL